METISRYLLTFLLNSLWQIPAISAVAALVCRMMHNGPANHRHAVWVAALLAAVLLPLASVRSAERAAGGPFRAPGAPQLVASANSSASPAATRYPAAPARRTISYGQTTATALLAAYLLFLVFRFAKLAWAWMRTVQILDAAGWAVAPSPVLQVWERCLETFGLRDVELLCSPRVPSPVAAGAWHRTIILPESLFGSASEEVLTTAIGHEMAHLARHDFALNLVYELLYLPVAFHPASWLILRGIEETREMACDELVTRKLLDAGVYARSIMSIAASMMAVPRPGYTLGVFDGDILEQRIRRLLHRPVANLKRARLLLAGGLCALVLCAVVASGVALTAQAQTADRADIDSRVKAARVLLDGLGPADTQRMSLARQALLDILARDPANQEALNGMMTVSMIAKQPAEGRQWALKMVTLYPKEKTSYYCVGFADWSVVYPAAMAVRTAAGMRPEDTNHIADASARHNLRDQYGSMIDEGMHMLDVALQMDPNYVDAMAYLNLMYRLKANVSETAAEAADAVSKADEWVGKALAAKRLAAASPSSGGSWMAAPPPPPPPPPPPQISDTALASDAPMPARHDVGSTFWQVIDATETPAKTLIVQLKAAGFPAGSALNARDNLVRVVVGPYPDDASLAEARSKLETAGYRVIRPW